MRPLALGLRAPYRLKRTIALLAQASLNIDFTRGGPIDSRVTFTRASGGTSFRPVSYGPNLVPYGTFDTLTGWVPQGSVTATGGKLTGTTPAGSNVFASGPNLFSVVAGKLYQLQYEYDVVTGSTHSIYINNPTYDTSLNPAFATTAGRRTHVFVAKNTGLVSLDVVGGGGSSVGTFDNIEVREVILDRPGDPIQLFTAPANVPRFDYDPVTRQCKGLLVEEQRTNFLLWSNDFTQSGWVKSGTGVGIAPQISGTPVLAPDNTLTATRITLSNTGTTYGDWSWMYYNLACTAGTTYCSSAFIRASNPADVGKEIVWPGASTFVKVVLTADWKLIENVGAPVSSGTQSFGPRIRGVETATTSVTFDIWQAQVEVGAFATSRIPTSGAAATRSAEAATLNTLAPWYVAGGTLFAEFTHTDTSLADRVVLSLHSTSWVNNAMHVRTFGSSAVVAGYNGATNDVSMSLGVARVSNKVAVASANNDFASCLNGGAVAVDNSGTVPPVSMLAIGCSSSGGGNSRNGHVRRVAYWPRRMSAIDLQGLTR